MKIETTEVSKLDVALVKKLIEDKRKEEKRSIENLTPFDGQFNTDETLSMIQHWFYVAGVADGAEGALKLLQLGGEEK